MCQKILHSIWGDDLSDHVCLFSSPMSPMWQVSLILSSHLLRKAPDVAKAAWCHLSWWEWCHHSWWRAANLLHNHPPAAAVDFLLSSVFRLLQLLHLFWDITCDIWWQQIFCILLLLTSYFQYSDSCFSTCWCHLCCEKTPSDCVLNKKTLDSDLTPPVLLQLKQKKQMISECSSWDCFLCCCLFSLTEILLKQFLFLYFSQKKPPLSSKSNMGCSTSKASGNAVTIMAITNVTMT